MVIKGRIGEQSKTDSVWVKSDINYKYHSDETLKSDKSQAGGFIMKNHGLHAYNVHHCVYFTAS